jgi:hypothetical protein
VTVRKAAAAPVKPGRPITVRSVEPVFELGDKVRDRVTGYAGVVTARIEYISGCVHVSLQAPADKDNKVPDALYVDENRCDLVEKAKPLTAGPVGGPASPGLGRVI